MTDLKRINTPRRSTTRIERDALNRPLALVMGDSSRSHSGRLVRE